MASEQPQNLQDIIHHDLSRGREPPVILYDSSASHRVGEFSVVTPAEITFTDGSSLKVASKGFRLDPRHHENRQFLLDVLTRKQEEWSILKHDNVCIWVLAILPNSMTENVLTPWYKNGTILEYSQNNLNADFLALVTQAGRGLACIHNAGLEHGNISPSNIMIDDDGKAIVTDGGFNISACRVIYDRQVPLPQSWALKPAEELFPNSGVNTPTQKADVYAFCSTVYSVYASQPNPFPHELPPRGAARIQRLGHINLLQKPALMPKLMWALLRRGWQVNSISRPTMDEVVEGLESLAIY